MGLVTIEGQDYAVYGTLAGADTHWAAGIGKVATAWRALVASGTVAAIDQRERLLVNATRLLDRQPWQGRPVVPQVPDVALAWPRLEVFYPDGTPVDSTVVPAQVIAAAYELAGLLLVTPGLLTSPTSGSNIKSAKAGPVEVEYFGPTLGNDGRFPPSIQELIGMFLGSNERGSTGGFYASGDCTERSSFTRGLFGLVGGSS